MTTTMIILIVCGCLVFLMVILWIAWQAAKIDTAYMNKIRKPVITGIRLKAESETETASVFIDFSDGTEIEFIQTNGSSIDYWKSIKELNKPQP